MTVTSNISAPLVVVVGATGVQGGSVVHNLIESDKAYRLRGLSRDSSQPAAVKLKDLGVEVVPVTIAAGNEAAVRKAFTGGEVVFAMTTFWEHKDAAREVAEGKLMVDAAKAVGVKLFIWSGLESFSKATNGRFTRVVHFDGKAEVAEYAFTQLSAVDVQAGFYMTNLATMFSPRELDDGSLVWDHPFMGSQNLLPYIDMDRDFGLFVRYAIETPSFREGGKTL
ncbi:NmrA-domain-containing protein [Auricularia subglabra TFB-10046 SS5]|nr:NmrA-domain-containing protein [Auricularia subglabra TFB-10046 SS5]